MEMYLIMYTCDLARQTHKQIMQHLKEPTKTTCQDRSVESPR